MSEYKEMKSGDLDQAEISGLSPSYYTARRFVDEVLEDVHGVKFDDVIKGLTDRVYEEMQIILESHLWSDAGANIQSRIHNTVDDIVNALLRGKGWALQQYVFTSGYNGEEIRKAIAVHAKDELYDFRIKELERANSDLQTDLSRATARVRALNEELYQLKI
jgi:hypothetical protein